MKAGSGRAGYLFGDTELAARRLELLARVYREPLVALVRDATAGRRPRLAVDFGCGIGRTTHQLADTLECRALGLDVSPGFVERARATATPSVRFAVHDVTRVPPPVEGADLLYARYLLTHLPEPEARVRAWLEWLAPGGLLLLEEPEWIETDVPALRRYLGWLAGALRAQGNELYLGPRLAGLDPGPRGRVRLSRVRRHRVDDRDAAALFAMNLPHWSADAGVQERVGAEPLRALAAELDALAAGPPGRSRIEWGLRQLAFERADS